MIPPASHPLSPAGAELFAVAARASATLPGAQHEQENVPDVAASCEDAVSARIEVRGRTDGELLAIVFDGPTPSPQAQSAGETAARLPRRHGRELGADGLVAQHHLPREWAMRLCCLYELVRQHPRDDDSPKVHCLNDALLLFDHLRASRVEVAAVLPLDADRRPLGVHVIGVGTLDRVSAKACHFLAPAVRANAPAIICAHTHPSGDPRPSKADEGITEALRFAADMVGIELLDHLILASRRSYSFADRKGWPTWTAL